MLTGEDIIKHAQRILLDDDTQPGGAGVLWPEIDDYLFSRIRKLITDKPNACTEIVPVSLVAGIVQMVPEETNVVIDIPRNTGGAAITPIKQSDLDATDPDWPTADPEESVIHYMLDERELTTFRVYPPNDGTGSVDLVRSFFPAYADIEDPLPIGDEYEMALVYGVLEECYSKNAKRGDVAKATFYAGQYGAALGLSGAASSANIAGTKNDAENE